MFMSEFEKVQIFSLTLPLPPDLHFLLKFSACLSSGTKQITYYTSWQRPLWTQLYAPHMKFIIVSTYHCNYHKLAEKLFVSFGLQIFSEHWNSLLLDGTAGREPVSICEVLQYLTHLQQQLNITLRNQDASGKENNTCDDNILFSWMYLLQDRVPLIYPLPSKTHA